MCWSSWVTQSEICRDAAWAMCMSIGQVRAQVPRCIYRWLECQWPEHQVGYTICHNSLQNLTGNFLQNTNRHEIITLLSKFSCRFCWLSNFGLRFSFCHHFGPNFYVCFCCLFLLPTSVLGFPCFRFSRINQKNIVTEYFRVNPKLLWL